MDLNLSGKTALITGGSQGIGFAIAQALAAEGMNLHLCGRSLESLASARAQLNSAFPVTVTTHSVDVSQSSECARLAEEISEIDALINNAGAVPAGSLSSIDESRWRAAWDLKVYGYINLSRIYFERMRARKAGTILNIIGFAGERPSAAFIAGSTGNAAIMALTKGLGATSLRDGVRVVGINPGPVATDRFVAGLRGAAAKRLGDPEKWRELIDQTSPPGMPSQIADAAAFLLSERAGHISGSILAVDGGLSMR